MIERYKRELELAGMFDPDSDYGGLAGKAVMELLEVLAQQGHSGYSRLLVANLFYDLVTKDILTPLKCDESEWFYPCDASPKLAQNNRCGSVFKDGDELPYFLNALVWQNKENGNCFTNGLSRIKFVPPFMPKMFYIGIDERVEDFGLCNPNIEVLREAATYYMPETITQEQRDEIKACFLNVCKYLEIDPALLFPNRKNEIKLWRDR